MENSKKKKKTRGRPKDVRDIRQMVRWNQKEFDDITKQAAAEGREFANLVRHATLSYLANAQQNTD